ncbi:MAG TPA: response regulator transcription factor [Solirubrobacterales bacterium]|nr:response regulator transcription factor [Solirubrobacterales bacterium]
MATKQPPISLVIADDHAVVRTGLRMLLERVEEFEVAAETGDAGEALELARAAGADVILLDLNMPGKPLEVLAEAAAGEPDAAVVVLTMEQDPAFARRAIDAGAAGYLLKRSAEEELVDAIRAVAGGEAYLGRDIEAALAKGGSGAEPADDLSERETEVLRLIARGKTNVEIAGDLSLSVRTIETHRTRIQQKLGLSSRPALVGYALERRLI